MGKAQGRGVDEHEDEEDDDEDDDEDEEDEGEDDEDEDDDEVDPTIRAAQSVSASPGDGAVSTGGQRPSMAQAPSSPIRAAPSVAAPYTP